MFLCNLMKVQMPFEPFLATFDPLLTVFGTIFDHTWGNIGPFLDHFEAFVCLGHNFLAFFSNNVTPAAPKQRSPPAHCAEVFSADLRCSMLQESASSCRKAAANEAASSAATQSAVNPASSAPAAATVATALTAALQPVLLEMAATSVQSSQGV